ncbi:MAG TPA: serine/threonine-protein kinase, partial [Candidatus Obscuribacter sp.]|nr:serine/threonine-protein kinase [Candidatus Obscuribacter sp.]
MEPDSQGANRQEQEHTQRVDGMTSAESVIARGPTSVSGYRPGQIIGGHYEVIELVGKGGMSLVYKTRHLLLNQLRAIKIILPQMDKDGRGLQRFQQEAKLATLLEHKNIVRTMEFASPSDGPPFLVMDFVEGRSLEQELSVLQRLSAERAVKIVLQIADALEYILSQGIIHRDLKPGNIILVKEKSHPGKGMPQDLVKLIDFGIARTITPDGDDSQGILYTPTGEVVGSPQHMSPEQCAGETLDERSEIYSLGCILYELLAGKPPIVGKNSLDTLRLQASVEARPLNKVVPDTAHIKELSRITSTCLEKDPEHRY